MYTVVRKHEIHCGHRVYQHEGKCKHLHGHSYVFEFHCRQDSNTLDDVGRVIDFSEIKSRLCEWLEDNFDHRMLLWEKDPLALYVCEIDKSVVPVPFNPTAENIADYMLKTIAPLQLAGTGIFCHKVVVHETGKCSASSELE